MPIGFLRKSLITTSRMRSPLELWKTGEGENLKKLNTSLGSLNIILWTANGKIYRRLLATQRLPWIIAKRVSVLRHINTKAVICGGAGEVFEAHMLSALIPSVQRLIQIGDYQ